MTVKDKLVAVHNTTAGFAIGIVRQVGAKDLAVVRMNDESRYVILGRRATETEARTLANREWLADMGR